MQYPNMLDWLVGHASGVMVYNFEVLVRMDRYPLGVKAMAAVASPAARGKVSKSFPWKLLNYTVVGLLTTA